MSTRLGGKVRFQLKQLQVRHRLGMVLLLLIMFLAAAGLPTLAHRSQDRPTVQGMSAESSLVEQGRTLYQAERFSEAAAVLQQAVAAFQSRGEYLQQAITFSNLSLAYQQLGQWQAATQAVEQSLHLLETGRNLGTSAERTQILAQALDVQGRLQLAQGQADTALTTWQRTADLYRQLGEQTALIRSQINAAQAMQALGLYLQARKTLTEVQQILEQEPDSLLKATGLRSLGNVLRTLGDFAAAQQVLEESLKVAQASSSPQAVGDTLLDLGNTARVRADMPAALKAYQQAATTSTSPTTRIQAQLNQLSLLLENQQFSTAEALWPQIQDQITHLPVSRTAVYAQINFAHSLMKLGVKQQALQTKEAASEKVRVKTNSPSPSTIAQLLSSAVRQAKSLEDRRAESYALGSLGELYEQTEQFSDAEDLTRKALFIAQNIDAPDIAYQWHWQLGRLLRKQENFQGAIPAYSEAFNTLKSLRRELVAINPDVQFSFRESVEPVYRQFVDLLLRIDGTTAPSQDNLKQARNVIESLQLAELENFFRAACLQAKVEIDEVVDRQQSTAAVIYPIILDQRLAVILKLPGQEQLRHYTTPVTQEQVENTVAELREALVDVTQTSQVKQLSQQVYNWLIRPAETQLANSGIKTLVFILDGALRNIPMAILYDQQQKKYLVEKYAIALTPGLQLISPKPLQEVPLNALTAGVSEKRQVENREFAPLGNVTQELQGIQSEVPKSKQLFNQAFTQTNLQNQLQAAPFSVVHIATHGEFSSNPEQTFILTWDKLLKVRDFDQLLRLSGQKQSGAIELLVLSACQTAEGDKRAALGLAGVAVRAGARSTLATLWSVDDESTTELMSQFYRALKTGVTKAEALQKAQLAIFVKEKRPYFWAPYVLVGNWL